jgi:CHASE2 domain-containing sensor protein
MLLRGALSKDPGFRAWVNGLLITFWLAVSALALLLGWLGSLSFASVLVVCAASVTIWRLMTRGPGKTSRPK